MKFINIISLIAIILLFSSCDSNRVYDKNEDFAIFKWKQNQKVDFEVNIEDNSPKSLFINFRHTFYFETRNVRLKMFVTTPNGDKETLDLNILLSEPDGLWFAECSGNICDLKYPVNYNISDTGKYIFSLEQDMRVDPLTNVMSIGIRVENKTAKDEN